MCQLPIKKQGLRQFKKCFFISLIGLLASAFVMYLFIFNLIKRVVFRFHLNSDSDQTMVNFSVIFFFFYNVGNDVRMTLKVIDNEFQKYLKCQKQGDD